MIVILEGPDGAGKTVTAQRLADRLSLAYHHEGVPPPGDLLEHYGATLDKLRGKDVVIDRFARGELVYGPIMRGRSRLDDEAWHIMQRLYRAVNAVEVLCLPPYEVCHKNWSSGRPEYVEKAWQYKNVYERFYVLRGDQFIYDYTNPGGFEQLVKIISTVGLASPLPKNMVGNLFYIYLIVGEQGANPQATHDLPFFSTLNSSNYLNKQLSAAGYREDELAFINAFQHDGTPNRLPLQSGQVTIALGAYAAAECRRQGLVPHDLPHPQYWKRFFASKYDEYTEMLRRCRR
jgi:hypothetical protein